MAPKAMEDSVNKFRDRVRNGIIERRSRCCGEWLPLTEFRRSAPAKHGRLYQCKLCYNEARRPARAAKYLRLRDQGFKARAIARMV